MRISDWSSDVCSSDLLVDRQRDHFDPGCGHDVVDGRGKDAESAAVPQGAVGGGPAGDELFVRNATVVCQHYFFCRRRKPRKARSWSSSSEVNSPSTDVAILLHGSSDSVRTPTRSLLSCATRY